MKAEKKLLGVVGVDSGQLVICDPGYIDSQWLEEAPGIAAEVYRDVKTGRNWQCSMNGILPVDPLFIAFKNYDTKIDRGAGCGWSTPNRLIEQGEWIKILEDPDKKTRARANFSYAACCDVTDSTDGGGQLNYEKGHAGVAVAFNAGLGDGLYEVWAHYVTNPSFGRRISKVEIKLITPKEIKMWNDLVQRGSDEDEKQGN